MVIELGPEGAKENYFFDNAFNNDEINSELPNLIQGMDKVFYPFGKKDGFDQLVINWMKTAGTKDRHSKAIDIADGSSLIGNLRLIKDSTEIQHMQTAADLASKAHMQAMIRTRPGLYEYHITAEFDTLFRKEDSEHSYPPIVAGGENACILHYNENNKLLNDGELLLIDAGCEILGYASDITRTFPINGKFSEPQKEIYEIVLKAQKSAIASKVGNNIMDPQITSEKIITKGLVELGILKGDVDDLHQQGAFKDFYMHKIGHWLGLDVHDPSEYKENKELIKLEPGMIFTVEPGIYIPDGSNCDERWWGIGIRIEDDILVTKTGPLNLTAKVPSDPKEIEALMA